MTAPIPTLRRRNHIVTQHYRLDDLIEWGLSSRGRENVGLALLAASCVGLIFALRWS